MIGEVWLCSGQSNIGMDLAMTPGTEADIAAADDPQVRVFTRASRCMPPTPAAEPDGKWEPASPLHGGEAILFRGRMGISPAELRASP